MNEHLQIVLEKRVNRTIGNLQNNKMDAYYVRTVAEVFLTGISVNNGSKV